MAGTQITIGVLSDHTGVNIETIRYYEKIGVMPEPPRTEGGRRLYDGALTDRLKFIRRGRELGFALDDIRMMLGIEDNPPTCEEVYQLSQRHLADIRSKIRDLKRLEKTLSETAKHCQRGVTTECAIVEALSG